MIKPAFDSRDNGGWSCYLCGAIKPRVVQLDHLRPTKENGRDGLESYQFLCDVCLWKEVVAGRLLVATPKQAEGVVQSAAESLTEEAQVIVTEDGTMVNEGTQFSWTE